MVQAQLGYASDHRGCGVAYCRLTSRVGERLVRVAFHIRRFAGLDEREVGYGAVTAVAGLLRERGIASVAFIVPDTRLVNDVNEHGDVPAPLVLPYVYLGCALNRFESFALRAGDDRDLAQRASAEVALQTAA